MAVRCTGRITRQAFEDPEGGLLVWILARLKLFHRGQRPHPCLAAAASLETLGKWFDFWDWSQVGFLTRGQVTRAVAREFEGRLPDLKCLDLVKDIWEKATEVGLFLLHEFPVVKIQPLPGSFGEASHSAFKSCDSNTSSG
eukprot:symbB.v1.2.019978.t3/scaffold1654.1/size107508/3